MKAGRAVARAEIAGVLAFAPPRTMPREPGVVARASPHVRRGWYIGRVRDELARARDHVLAAERELVRTGEAERRWRPPRVLARAAAAEDDSLRFVAPGTSASALNFPSARLAHLSEATRARLAVAVRFAVAAHLRTRDRVLARNPRLAEAWDDAVVALRRQPRPDPAVVGPRPPVAAADAAAVLPAPTVARIKSHVREGHDAVGDEDAVARIRRGIPLAVDVALTPDERDLLALGPRFVARPTREHETLAAIAAAEQLNVISHGRVSVAHAFDLVQPRGVHVDNMEPRLRAAQKTLQDKAVVLKDDRGDRLVAVPPGAALVLENRAADLLVAAGVAEYLQAGGAPDEAAAARRLADAARLVRRWCPYSKPRGEGIRDCDRFEPGRAGLTVKDLDQVNMARPPSACDLAVRLVQVQNSGPTALVYREYRDFLESLSRGPFSAARGGPAVAAALLSREFPPGSIVATADVEKAFFFMKVERVMAALRRQMRRLGVQLPGGLTMEGLEDLVRAAFLEGVTRLHDGRLLALLGLAIGAPLSCALCKAVVVDAMHLAYDSLPREQRPSLLAAFVDDSLTVTTHEKEWYAALDAVSGPDFRWPPKKRQTYDPRRAGQAPVRFLDDMISGKVERDGWVRFTCAVRLKEGNVPPDRTSFVAPRRAQASVHSLVYRALAIAGDRDALRDALRHAGRTARLRGGHAAATGKGLSIAVQRAIDAYTAAHGLPAAEEPQRPRTRCSANAPYAFPQDPPARRNGEGRWTAVPYTGDTGAARRVQAALNNGRGDGVHRVGYTRAVTQLHVWNAIWYGRRDPLLSRWTCYLVGRQLDNLPAPPALPPLVPRCVGVGIVLGRQAHARKGDHERGQRKDPPEGTYPEPYWRLNLLTPLWGTFTRWCEQAQQAIETCAIRCLGDACITAVSREVPPSVQAAFDRYVGPSLRMRVRRLLAACSAPRPAV